MQTEPSTGAGPEQRRWQPLSAIDRRVAGVLVEKAKTTPDAYPMSLAALRAGCNQKSNRDPEMNLEAEDIEESIERLKKLGAVTEVTGGGRVSRYRHHLYEWLGVEKVEMAVMAELLLRGAQTEGELRGRAARMEPIADLAALRPVLASLKAKGLVVPLTPEGRGHTITHALYPPAEMDRLRARFAGRPAGADHDASAEADAAADSGHDPSRAAASDSLRQQFDSLADELRRLREDVDSLRARLETLER